uniref:Uncharacterized protein n=1 Tax=Plectus sambesii TaxID=2011161 RepID=A0A914UQH5_9BILA
MAFYLNPPSGILSLSEVRLAILTRFKFLAELYRVKGDSEAVWSKVAPKFIADAQYLMEGTTTDRCAHFLLRLVAHVDPLVLEFVTHCERMLFKVRMEALNSTGFCKMFGKLRRHLYLASMDADDGERRNWQLISEAVVALVESKGGSQQLANAFTAQSTSTQPFLVPFTFVLPLIRTRQVILSGGFAEILPADLPLVLTGIFDKITALTAKRSSDAFCQTVIDERIAQVANELKAVAYEYGINVGPPPIAKYRSKVNSEQIDQFSLLFPPCMRHLHRELRAKHRLKHHQRVS